MIRGPIVTTVIRMTRVWLNDGYHLKICYLENSKKCQNIKIYGSTLTLMGRCGHHVKLVELIEHKVLRGRPVGVNGVLDTKAQLHDVVRRPNLHLHEGHDVRVEQP